jgi:hypothetical protein
MIDIHDYFNYFSHMHISLDFKALDFKALF